MGEVPPEPLPEHLLPGGGELPLALLQGCLRRIQAHPVKWK